MSASFIYAVRDNEAGRYIRIVNLLDNVIAKRMFRIYCKQEVGEFKDDFQLERIAMFEDTTGIISPVEHEVVITGKMVNIGKGDENV